MPPQHQQQHVNYGLSTLPEHALETSIATHDLAEYGSDILSFMYELEVREPCILFGSCFVLGCI